MTDLVRRSHAPVPQTWRSRRDIEAVERQAQVNLLREDSAATLAMRRIVNTIDLGRASAQKIAQMRREITAESYDDPALEMYLRDIERRVVVGVGNVLDMYVEGRW